MAQFNLVWYNTAVIINPNVTGQRVSHRQKSVGGTFSSSGYTPANDLPKTASSSLSPALTDNVVYEFKVQAICSIGGPTNNDNGLVEQIGFGEIPPVLVNGDDSSQITVDLSDTDVTKVEFVLRNVEDDAIVYGPVIVTRTGDSVTTEAAGLPSPGTYYWETRYYATVGGTEVESSETEYEADWFGKYELGVPVELSWIANDIVCEKEGAFGVVKTISGLSSPFDAWYNPLTGLVIVADGDAAGGNVYWFNPNTATTAADITFSTAVHGMYYTAAIDKENKRIYFAGISSGGLIVYDITTDTILTTVAFGVNGIAFNRMNISVGDNFIYVNDTVNSSIAIIDRTTLTLTENKPISSIPNNARFIMGGYVLKPVNSEIWVLAGSGSTISTLGVYSEDFSTNVTNITLTGATHWTGSKYWQNGFHDVVSGHFYASDFGSKRRYVIDVASKAVLNNQVIDNSQGKVSVQCYWTVNPINNDLLSTIIGMNDPSDSSSIKRAYIEDRTTFIPTKMFVDETFIGLSRITGTNDMLTTYAGVPQWSGNPAYSTDGTVTVLSSSVGTENTGRAIVLNLKEVNANAGNLPTGEIKDNDLSDPDYIAPYDDPTLCPITYTTDCPTDKVTTFTGDTLYWEASFKSSVINNPAIEKIQVFAYNNTTALTEGLPEEYTAPFTTNYYSGNFVGLAGSSYTIKIKYLNSSDVELQNC